MGTHTDECSNPECPFYGEAILRRALLALLSHPRKAVEQAHGALSATNPYAHPRKEGGSP